MHNCSLGHYYDICSRPSWDHTLNCHIYHNRRACNSWALKDLRNAMERTSHSYHPLCYSNIWGKRPFADHTTRNHSCLYYCCNHTACICRLASMDHRRSPARTSHKIVHCSRACIDNNRLYSKCNRTCSYPQIYSSQLVPDMDTCDIQCDHCHTLLNDILSCIVRTFCLKYCLYNLDIRPFLDHTCQHAHCNCMAHN